MTRRGTIILSTFPSKESVADMANHVVRLKICACVNFAEIRSIYSWRGKIEDQPEFIALFKTTATSAKKLKAEIAKLHPYDVPEIVELKMTAVSKSYLSWLAESTNGVAKNRHYSAK